MLDTQGSLIALLFLARLASAQCPERPRSDSIAQLHAHPVVLRVSSVWRSFRPRIPPLLPDGGSDLMVGIQFRHPKGHKVQEAGQVTRVWVRRDTTWLSLSVDSAWTSWDSVLVGQAARDGPRWPAGTLIDVAVEWKAAGETRCTLFSQRAIESPS